MQHSQTGLEGQISWKLLAESRSPGDSLRRGACLARVLNNLIGSLPRKENGLWIHRTLGSRRGSHDLTKDCELPKIILHSMKIELHSNGQLEKNRQGALLAWLSFERTLPPKLQKIVSTQQQKTLPTLSASCLEVGTFIFAVNHKYIEIPHTNFQGREFQISLGQEMMRQMLN